MNPMFGAPVKSVYHKWHQRPVSPVVSCPPSSVSCQLSSVSHPLSAVRLVRRAGGFTLLELMLALTILGLMSAVVYSSFRLSLKSYSRSQERLEEEARKRVLGDLIKRQIGSLFPVRPTGSFLEPEPEGAQAGRSPRALSQFPLFYGSPESVTFVTVAPLMLQRNPGLTVVRYGLSEDEWGGLYLGAMETRYQGFDSFLTMVEVPRGKPLPLVEPVADLQFEYYGYDAEAQDYQWLDVWDGERMQSVPEAIRIHYDGQHLVVPSNAVFVGRQRAVMPGMRSR